MVSDHERRLAELAVEKRYLTAGQLEECFRRKQVSPAPLEHILVQCGYLTTAEVGELLRFAHNVPPARLFAEILRERGLATAEQIEQALAAKRELARRNVHRYLGEILVERRVLSPEQVSQILAQQGKVPLECSACGYRFNALHGAGYECPECGRAIDRAAGPAPRRHGACVLGEEIGHGPAGAVYRAFHERLRQDVALKVVAPDVLGRERRDRYLFQARRSMALAHPNVARVLEAWAQEGRLFVASEYVESVPLFDHVIGSLRLPLEDAVGILKQAAAAVGAAHARGMSHGNLKAHNVLVTETREVKVTDFGLALDASLDRPGRPSAGAPGAALARGAASLAPYLAPERWKYGPTPPADLYACGILWYFMLTGSFPFEAGTPEEIRLLHHSARSPSLRRAVPDLPRGAEAIFVKLTYKEPSLRYRHAAALMEDLDRLENGEPTLAEREQSAAR
jgi:predicted RNA-binding Zn-ribbon protein involved in translation (DUF1610 family)